MKKLLTLTLASLLLCACTKSSYDSGIIVIENDSVKYWKHMYVRNGQEITLLPKFIDGKPDIDSVKYYWEDQHLATTREMPFASQTTVRVDTAGRYNQHNVVYYHGARSIDYLIVYTVRK